jgi:hypothetical protein
MRPSLQPYLASKSAFTMAPSWSLAAVALTSASAIRILTRRRASMLRAQLALSARR